SNDALDEVRAMIGERYGADYAPEKPNFYKSKKDAQDAHEAVRPTSSLRTPAVFDQTTIDVEASGKDKAVYLFRATGSVPKFDGFLRVYEEGKDAKNEENAELKKQLPGGRRGRART